MYLCIHMHIRPCIHACHLYMLVTQPLLRQTTPVFVFRVHVYGWVMCAYIIYIVFCVCVCVCVCVCTCVCVYMCTHTRIHTHMYKQVPFGDKGAAGKDDKDVRYRV